MKPLRLSLAALVLAACSGAPTVVEPAAPGFDALAADGGSGLGSGNFYDDGGGSGSQDTSLQTTQPDTTRRDPNMIGSGN